MSEGKSLRLLDGWKSGGGGGWSPDEGSREREKWGSYLADGRLGEAGRKGGGYPEVGSGDKGRRRFHGIWACWRGS